MTIAKVIFTLQFIQPLLHAPPLQWVDWKCKTWHKRTTNNWGPDIARPDTDRQNDGWKMQDLTMTDQIF